MHTFISIGLLVTVLGSVDAVGVAHERQASVADAAARSALVSLVEKVRRADYEADLGALARLHDELAPFTEDKGLTPRLRSRVLYWRGFAMWRRALNGFSGSLTPAELGADLRKATTDFQTARTLDPGFIDAQVGEASCVVNRAVLDLKAPESLSQVRHAWSLVETALAAAPENPRLLWVHGANLWWGPTERGGRPAAIDTYTRGLTFARQQKGRVSDPLEPIWGEPELLMNLAFANANQTPPDLDAAERYAREALDLVPHWHYVRNILLKGIVDAKAAARRK